MLKIILWILSINLMANISFNLYPDIVKVKKSKPKKSKTEQGQKKDSQKEKEKDNEYEIVDDYKEELAQNEIIQ